MLSLLHNRMLDNNWWREYYSPIGVMIITETRLRIPSLKLRKSYFLFFLKAAPSLN